MASVELEYAEKRMRQKWHDLVMEEQRGASVPMLERMFNAYMLAVEEYNRCVEVYAPQRVEYSNKLKKKAS
jgi:hypothetical protein